MKKTKKILLIIIILLVLLLIVSASIYGVIYYKKSKYTFKLKDAITVSLNTEINPSDYIKEMDNVKVYFKNIDTSKTGKYKIEYTVVDKLDKKHNYYLKVTVVDDDPPIIEQVEKNTTILEGSELNLLKYVKATDANDENVDIKTEGEVDTRKPGKYEVKYIATDSSGNKVEKTITFTIKAKEVVTNPQPTTNTNNNVDITKSSKGYKVEVKNGVTYVNDILIANKTYGLPSTYNPGGLTSETKKAADEMFAAAKAVGYNMWAQSGFRSYATQQKLYNRYVSRDGKAKADTYSARPGYSEHQTGLAFDVCATNKPCINSGFNNTAEAKWLAQNAHLYGFILRYPQGKTNETGYQYESWHFRYVGKDIAKELYNDGNWITLESYLGITSQYQD